MFDQKSQLQQFLKLQIKEGEARKANGTEHEESNNFNFNDRNGSVQTTEVHKKSSLYDKSKNESEKHTLVVIDNLKQLLEKLTKKYNSTCSVNQKIRFEINAFRKERTLFDHVFKNLESLILQEENKLSDMLKKNNDFDILIKEADENLANIKEKVQKHNDDDFMEILYEEKRKYDGRLVRASDYGRQSIAINLHNMSKVTELEDQFVSDKKTLASKSQKMTEKKNLIQPNQLEYMSSSENGKTVNKNLNENEERIVLIEQIIKDLKYKTEENNFEDLILSNDELIPVVEENYQILLTIEDEVSSLV